MYSNSQYPLYNQQPTTSQRFSNMPQLHPIQSVHNQPQASMNAAISRNFIERGSHRSIIEKLPIDSDINKPNTASFQQAPNRQPVVFSNSQVVK
jgi:hypothetical protein